jgi:hypothetical protein
VEPAHGVRSTHKRPCRLFAAHGERWAKANDPCASHLWFGSGICIGGWCDGAANRLASLGAFFFVGAVLGTAGPWWAVRGYDQRSAKWVLLLLVIGELTILRPLTAVLLSTMSEPIDTWTLVALGLTLGPFIIGVIHVVASAGQIIPRRA